MEGKRSAGRLAWPDPLTWLRILIAVTLLVLSVQYVLGMELTHYSSPPYASSDLVFSLHYSLGIASVGLALAVLAVSVLTRHVVTVLTSTVGFLSVAAAGQAGRVFAFSGQNEAYSLVMSVGFLIGFSSYFSEALSIRRILASKPAEP